MIAVNDKDIKESHRLICSLLSARKLKPAFDSLEQLISANGLGEFRDEYLNLEQNYRFMLKYTVEGINDPERQKIYKHLLVSAFELADGCAESLRMKYSQSLEYQKKRGFARLYIEDLTKYLSILEDYHLQLQLRALIDEPANSPKDNMEAEVHLQKTINAFYHIWFKDKLSEAEINFFRAYLQSEAFPYHEKSLLITALTLGLIRFFDENRFMLLFECYGQPDEEVSQRALVGLMIGLYHYNERMPFFPAITSRLLIETESSAFKLHLEKIILHFIRSKETEKIQRKLQDEILPEMFKLSPNLRNKLSLEGLLGEGLTEDKNPEWQEIFKDSPGLMNKMEELTEMQLEGADVFMSSFSMLKNFPFFSELSNWFYPFDPRHPEIVRRSSADDSNNKLFKLILSSSMLCNSDKYSFCFSIQTVPDEYKKMLSESMASEFDQMGEEEKEDNFLSHSKKAEVVSGQYIRDLYRFYKLHPQHNDFEDIFNWKFDFHNKVAFRKLLLEEPKLLRNIAEFYFAKNYFAEAAEIFLLLMAENKEAELLQKLAFSYQKQGNYREALSYYLKADLFEQNKLWNLKKIALCYRNLKQPDKALEYYQQAVLLEPDNLSTHVSIGQCQMELGQYADALRSYFKVEYLSPGNKKIWRPIGWCSLLVGKTDQAASYYQKLIDDSPNKYDLMNMGHVLWCQGHRKEALDFYKLSINNTDNSEEEFMVAFNEDLQHLLRQGVDPDDVPIMLDQLRYSL